MSATKLEMQYPPRTLGDELREAIPCGNGEVGALLCGNIACERVLINHGLLWHGGRSMPLPDVSDTLAQVRRMLDEGDMYTANERLCEALQQQGYDATLSTPHPLVEWEANFHHTEPFRHYKRGLDMENGEASIRYTVGHTAVQRRLAVSRDNGCVLIEIASSDPLDWTWRLRVPEAESEEAAQAVADWRENVQWEARGNVLLYHGGNGLGVTYGCAAGVVSHEGGEVSCQNGTVCLQGVTRATVLIRVFAGAADPKAALEEAYAYLCGQTDSYDVHFRRHRRLHRQLFRAARLQLGHGGREKSNEQLLLDSYGGEISPLLLNKLWNFGRYLLISGTREGGLPCPLFGLWHTGYLQYWSQNMANVNLQMIYWQSFAGNLLPLFRSVIDYYYERMDVFRDNARKLFGCRGIYIPAGTTPYEACPNQIVPVIMNWTGAAGWLCQSFYRYYRLSDDEAYYREKILPLMRETAAFYEDFICYDEQGKVKLYPGVSPENSPGNFMQDGYKENMTHAMPTTVNPTMEIAIVRELLTNLLQLLPQDACAPRWRAILAALPALRTNEDGAIREWQDDRLDDNYYHRHLSHLYPVFPGNEKRSLDAAAMEAFRRAVELRCIDSQTGWSFAFMACIYARLGLSDVAMESLNSLIRTCVLGNFMTTHNDWRSMGMTVDLWRYAPIQLDANMGLVTAVNEMLFYSEDNYLQILPACPSTLSVGKMCGFVFDGGTLDMRWDLSVGMVALTLFPRVDGAWYVEWPACCCEDETERVQRIQLQKGVPHTLYVG